MRAGTQIVYIPHHAEGDVNHEDVEFGFVVHQDEEVVYCRYWRQGGGKAHC